MSTRFLRCAPAVAALIVCSLGAASASAADAPAKPGAKALEKVKNKLSPPPAFTVPDAQPDQVKAAELVFYGPYDCEFQQTVNITQSQKYSGYVDVKHGAKAWLMKPVLSSTGAIRLEDVRGETLMVQIAMIAEAKAAKAAAEAAPIKAATEAGTAATAPLLK
jgi:hypothetical protein